MQSLDSRLIGGEFLTSYVLAIDRGKHFGRLITAAVIDGCLCAGRWCCAGLSLSS
jgi:hypothetical protein